MVLTLSKKECVAGGKKTSEWKNQVHRFQMSQWEECSVQLSLDKWKSINVTGNWSRNCWQRIKVLIFRFKPICMKPHAVIEPIAKHTTPYIRKESSTQKNYSQGFKAHKFLRCYPHNQL